MKTRMKFLWMVLGIFVMLLNSCGGNAGNAGSESASEPTLDPNILLSNPKIGLDSLKSYHMRFTQEFDGKADGQPVHTKVEHTMDVVRSAQTEFVTLQQIGTDGNVESFLTGVIGDASYRRTGDEKSICHIVWNQEVKASPSNWPVEMVPAISSGEKTGEDEVNAVNTVHYKLNNDSLGVKYFESVSGDLWFSKEAGYVVKLELDLTGNENTFGKGRSGTKKLTYELTKINTNEDFIAPPGCLSVLDGVPIMADAEREYRLPGNLRYYTASSPEQVLAFYKEELTAQGWQMGNVHESSEKGQVLLFVKSETDERLHLGLTPEKDTTLVSVFVGKPSQGEQPPGVGETGKFATPTPIALDPDKAGLPDGVPIYPGAENFTGFPGIKLDFTTTDSGKQVLDFYKTSLVKDRWSPLPGSANVPGAPAMFRKGSIMLVIRATEKDGGSQVEIMMVKQ